MANDQLARYSAYLNRDPDNIELLVRTISLCLDTRELNQGRILLDRALSIDASDPRLTYYAAILHMAEHDFESAATGLADLLAAGIDNPGVRYNLGLCHLHTHQPQRAYECLKVFEEAVPHEAPHAKLLLVRALHHLGELEAAQRQVGQYLEACPGSAEAIGYQALLQLDGEGTNEQCEAAAHAALQHDPENSEALIVLGTLALERYDVAAAQPYFDRVLARNPNSGRAWLAKGIAALAAHDAEGGERLLQKTIAVMPAHLGTRVALGWAQLTQMKLDDAERTFSDAIALNRTFGESHAGLAIAWIMQGRFEEAAARTKLAKRLTPPGTISVQFAEAVLAHAGGDVSKAQALAASLVDSPVTAGSPTVREALLKLSRQGPGTGNQMPPPR